MRSTGSARGRPGSLFFWKRAQAPQAAGCCSFVSVRSSFSREPFNRARGHAPTCRIKRKRLSSPSRAFDPIPAHADDSESFGHSLSGGEEEFRVGVLAAQADGMQEWKEGTEFKAIRERSLSAGGSR